MIVRKRVILLVVSVEVKVLLCVERCEVKKVRCM